MQVRDIMTEPAITVRPDASIQEIAALMRTHNISAVPVVSAQDRLVGIVTEVDLIARHAPPQAPNYLSLLWGLIPLQLNDYAKYKEQVRHILAVNAEQLMTKNPQTVDPEDSIEHVASLMMRPGYRSLPVVEDGELVGIITRTDLVQMIEDLEMADEE